MIRAEQPMGRKLILRSRLTAIPFDWSPAGNQFRLSRFPVKLSKKFKKRLDHFLAACEIRKSTIRQAGHGVFISEAATKGQILFKYGGRRISFPEADRLLDMVPAFSCFVFKHIQFCYTSFDCNQFYRDWILTSRQFPLMLFAMTRGRIISSGWSGSFGTILLVDSSTPTEETCATQNSWQSGTKFLLLQPRTSEGARKCLSITKFADGPNFMKCSLFRASE